MSDGIEPTPDPKTGVPWCSSEQCSSYDGKRCALTGFRPDSICEPAVIKLIGERNMLLLANEAWRRTAEGE